jgi:hypothetical protein
MCLVDVPLKEFKARISVMLGFMAMCFTEMEITIGEKLTAIWAFLSPRPFLCELAIVAVVCAVIIGLHWDEAKERAERRNA